MGKKRTCNTMILLAAFLLTGALVWRFSLLTVRAQESVLGVKPELIIRKLHEKLPVRFEVAQGPCRMDCVLFGIDEKSGQCASVERFSIW